ncbi:MAG: radical SAM protein [Rikenellaceae bacterium]|nr:radical SAM protein [Rikenellaceae bacterium]
MQKTDYIARLNEGSTLNIIFQLTDKCVLSCKYCFAKGAHKGKTNTFSYKLLETAIKQAFETRHKRVCFEWTGGEPLLVGIDFYKKVVELQNKYASKPYENGVQTSGNLLDKELINFLIQHNFSISTTIDGTAEIHNQNRPTNSGNPSLQNALDTRQYILDQGGSCGFISTITKYNLGHEKEMLDFFQSLGTYSFHSNPYIYYDGNRVKDNSIALSPEDFARYFIAEFNAWIEKGRVRPIPRTIYDIIKALKHRKQLNRSICTYGGRCLTNFIALTPNGDAYNCPKFTGSDNMRLGNIKENSISEILSLSSDLINKLIDQRVEAIKRCKSNKCNYFYICNGGCPYHSFIASNGKNISEKDILCDGKILLFEYIESVISQLTNLEDMED